MALTKSREDKILAGVIGGLAQEWGIDSTVLRIVYVVFTLLTALVVGLLVYLLLYLVMD